jgi:hypothetical protein
MSSERGYGVPVDTDGVSSALESTRRLRLALNILWDELPDELNLAGPVRDALESIHDRINEVETAGLRRYGLRSTTSSSGPSAWSARPRHRLWRK